MKVSPTGWMTRAEQSRSDQIRSSQLKDSDCDVLKSSAVCSMPAFRGREICSKRPRVEGTNRRVSTRTKVPYCSQSLRAILCLYVSDSNPDRHQSIGLAHEL
jgi:hypothetical protein